jgi:hypothetical protein
MGGGTLLGRDSYAPVALPPDQSPGGAPTGLAAQAGYRPMMNMPLAGLAAHGAIPGGGGMVMNHGMPIGSGRMGRAEGGLNVHVKHVHRPRLRSHAHLIHEGPIHSSVAGRTDHLPMHVESGSYVVPADIVSGMGEGNTIAGFKHMHRMFGGMPRGEGPTPYRGEGGPYHSGAHPYDQASGPYQMPLKTGGETRANAAPVPIVAAGGEWVIPPRQVLKEGRGDMDRGHKVLDKWVLKMRAELIKTLKHLKPPKKD